MTNAPIVMGVLRLLGGLAGIAALLALLIVAIWAAMWLVLLVVRHVPIVGRRHRHDRWTDMQRVVTSSTRAPTRPRRRAGWRS